MRPASCWRGEFPEIRGIRVGPGVAAVEHPAERPTMPDLKAVIFDLDGILCDTSIYHAQAWADLVRAEGIEPPSDLEERVKGISRMASLKIALGEHAKDYSDEQLNELAARKNACYLEAAKAINPADIFPGVKDLFADLKQNDIKVVLGSASKNAKAVLEGLELIDEFDAIADGYAYKHGKPHPNVFVSGAGMVGAQPHECIVVEDATAGINAALDGGFVAVGMGAFDSLKHADMFVDSLTELDAARLCRLHARCRPDRWSIRRDQTDPEREGSFGTLFCVGNGHVGVRGSRPGAGQGVYVAGFYDRINRGPQDVDNWSPFLQYWGNPDLARDDQIEVCLVNAPDFLQLGLAIAGERVDWDAVTLHRAERRLDMRSGMYQAEYEYEVADGKRFALTLRRFAAADNVHQVHSQYVLEPLNFSAPLTILSGISGLTENHSNRGPEQLYDIVATEAVDARAAIMAVKGRRDGMEAVVGSGLNVLDRPHAVYEVKTTPGRVAVATEVDVEQDQLLYFEQVAVLATNRLAADCKAEVRQELLEAARRPFSEMRISHIECWHQYWDASDVLIDGNSDDQLAIRFSIYHLLLSASQADASVSIPAKGLSGDGYRGMVFWDTDIHMTPFFNFTQPAMARNLAMFRFHTLDGARRKARERGYRGAWYPWETGVSGDEECEKWLKLITHQSHITADVAYALQQYADCTRDDQFARECLPEVLLETARFWVSKATPDGNGGYAIPAAGGPDEFHVVCDNSAYVCHLAAHNLRLADQVLRELKNADPAALQDLLERTGATAAEIENFAEVAAGLPTMQREDGVLEQCAGYFALRDEIDPKHGGPRPFETQCVKQADVIMLMYLLPELWSAADLQVNYDYYEPRTIHASSLSHAVYGIIAARLGRNEVADDYIRRSLGMDLQDEMNNTAAGAHMAANGMNWLAIVRGYAGCRPRGDVFHIESPTLPQDWDSLEFRLQWHGADFTVVLTADTITVRNAPDAAELPLNIDGRGVVVAPAEEFTGAL